MSLIQVSDVTFAYEGSYDNIFEHMSFQVDTNWRLGFTGRNGRGKTTFLRLLTGELPYSGRISTDTRFTYFPYTVETPELDTLAVLQQVCPAAEKWALLREFSRLELREDVLIQPFDTLSNGEQTKALLAALFLREHNFLLIDEPTNHLDLHAREAVARYLRSKRGFILVSHDRDLLDACVDHMLVLGRCDIQVQRGNFSTWWHNKQMQDEHERSQNKRLQSEVRRLEQAARRTEVWSDALEKTKYGSRSSGLRPDRGYIGHKSAKIMQRAKAIEGRRESALREKAQLLKNVETAESLKLTPLPYHRERLVLLEDVAIYYGDRRVCENVRFSVDRGDRVALQGANGSGKSSLLRLICREDIRHSGTFQRGSELKISYISQDISGLHGSLADYAREHGIDESLFKAILRKLDVSRTQLEKDIAAFSSGQKKKVLIAGSLCQQAHLYVWDEPLNDIDVLSRMQIEELLLTYRPTLLFVEHDRAFCRQIATKTVTV